MIFFFFGGLLLSLLSSLYLCHLYSMQSDLPQCNVRKSNDGCKDQNGTKSGLPWTDSYGETCAVYAEMTQCDSWGHENLNDEGSANDKCCVCGGGDSPYNSPSSTSTSTTTCVAGKYMDTTTNTCTACPAGQYQAENGFSGEQCWSCHQNTYQDVSGAASCNNCNTGEESGIGATECHQTHTPAVPVCNPCTSYAQFQDEHQLQYRQDSAGKCWSTK